MVTIQHTNQAHTYYIDEYAYTAEPLLRTPLGPIRVSFIGGVPNSEPVLFHVYIAGSVFNHLGHPLYIRILTGSTVLHTVSPSSRVLPGKLSHGTNLSDNSDWQGKHYCHSSWYHEKAYSTCKGQLIRYLYLYIPCLITSSYMYIRRYDIDQRLQSTNTVQ